MTDLPRSSGEGRPRRATLDDVAAHAGVSAVTVSRALRRPEMVSADLRQRIDMAVRELGYVPNQLASALASARTGTIGVIVPSLTNGVFVDYLRALHDAFQPSGFQVMVLNSRYLVEEEDRAIATLLGQHPEAMILTGVDQSANARRLLEQARIPVVQTMEVTADPIDINIGLSHVDAGQAATRYLLDLGHRKIGHLTARLDPRARRRAEGYRLAMQMAGEDSAGRVAATPRASTTALGGELLRELLENVPGLEAVFTCNDDLALGALFECQRRGIRVPEDLSIVGFNDLEVCAAAFPAITSVATPRYEMGRLAAEIISRIIRGDGVRPQQRVIDLGFKINARASTGRRAQEISARAAV
jgi:LacI family gluconate utilization system Gnt-I transcriptional repressor